MHRRSLPLGVTLATLCAVAPAGAQEVTIRFTPPVGQTTHYRSVNQTWMQIPGMAAADPTVPTTQVTMYMTRTITGMDGTARVVTTVVDSAKSETPGMPGMAGMMGGRDMMRGMSTTQKIDPMGRVLSTDVTPPPGLPPQFAQRLSQNAGRGNPAMPERAVKPGDTWMDSMTTATPAGRGQQAETKIRMTLRLERVEQRGSARIAVISLTGTVQGDSTGAAAMTGGTMTGEYEVDLDAGRIGRSTTDLNAVMQSPRGTMPIRIKSTMEALP